MFWVQIISRNKPFFFFKFSTLNWIFEPFFYLKMENICDLPRQEFEPRISKQLFVENVNKIYFIFWYNWWRESLTRTTCTYNRFSNFSCMFLYPNNFSNLNSNCSNLMDLRNLQGSRNKLKKLSVTKNFSDLSKISQILGLFFSQSLQFFFSYSGSKKFS